jgi:hypothetical protein
MRSWIRNCTADLVGASPRPAFRRLVAVSGCVALLGSLVTGIQLLAVAAASAQPTGNCGDVLLAGSNWLDGGGVNVNSNGADEGTGSDCSSSISYVNGVEAGQQWQCVEMINRLYLTKGWINSTWTGDAGPAFYNNAPASLAKQANGSVSYLGPGDVVIINVFLNGAPEGGHALVVNDSSAVTSGTVDLVSQNSGYGSTAEPQVTGTISGGSVSVGGGGNGWTYTTVGVVHAPQSGPPPPSGDLSFVRLNYYTGQTQVVTYSAASGYQTLTQMINCGYAEM